MDNLTARDSGRSSRRAMAVQWYYALGGERYGPVDSATLKRMAASGELGPHDLVWHEGAPDWTTASHVRGLFPEEMKGANPPSAQPSPEPPPPPSPTAPPPPPASPVPAAQPPVRLGAESPRTGRWSNATRWLDLFDWKFRKYLTPWIVRASWVISVIMCGLWIAIILLAVLISWIPRGQSHSPSLDLGMLGPEFEGLQLPMTGHTPLSRLPSWFSKGVIGTALGVTAIFVVLLTGLWVRVFLETVIVVFNIADTLTAIEKKL